MFPVSSLIAFTLNWLIRCYISLLYRVTKVISVASCYVWQTLGACAELSHVCTYILQCTYMWYILDTLNYCQRKLLRYYGFTFVFTRLFLESLGDGAETLCVCIDGLLFIHVMFCGLSRLLLEMPMWS